MNKPMRLTALSVAVALMFCWSALAVADDASSSDLSYTLQLKARYWFTDLSAKTSEITSLDREKLSLTDEVGMDPDDMLEGQLVWRITERNSLKLAYTQLNGDGDRVLSRAFILDDTAYAGLYNRVRTDLSLDYGRIGWRYAFVNTAEERFRLETILDVAVFHIKADYRVSHPLIPVGAWSKDDFSFTGALPLVGLAATWSPIKRVAVFGEFSGMTAGDYGYLFDTEAGLRFTPWKYTSLEAGYRFLAIKGRDHGEDARAEINGPFVGVGVQF